MSLTQNKIVLSKTTRLFFVVSALLGATGVGLGAYASHGLNAWATTQQVGYFQTAVNYQLLHAIALLAISILSIWLENRYLFVSQICMTIGTLFFSGSLYLYVITGTKILGAITPIGGLLFIIAWLLIIPAVLTNQKRETTC